MCSEVDLEGLSAVVQIVGCSAESNVGGNAACERGDPHPLPRGRGEEQSTLCVTDEETADECDVVIRLMPDPWKRGLMGTVPVRGENPHPRPLSRRERGGREGKKVIVASVLDSPVTVLKRSPPQTSGSPLPPGEGLGEGA